MRCICNTRAYQRTSRALSGNDNDQALFSHMAVKAIRGPVLLALLEQVLGKAPPEKAPTGGKNSPRPKTTVELLDTAGYDESPDERPGTRSPSPSCTIRQKHEYLRSKGAKLPHELKARDDATVDVRRPNVALAGEPKAGKSKGGKKGK